MACKCFCGACQQNLHEHCSNTDKMLCTAPCGCCCTACKKSDHRNCSHMNECPEKQKAGLYDTNQARANAAASAKDIQSLAHTPAAAAASAPTPPNIDDPNYDPWAGPSVQAAPPPPVPPAAVPVVAVNPVLAPESMPASPAQLAPPTAAPQVLGSIFASPEAQEAARAIQAERLGNGEAARVRPAPQPEEAPPPMSPERPLEPAWRIASELASLEATLSMYEDEVATKAPGPARSKVLLELSQALSSVREVGLKAHEMAKLLERVRVAANALEDAQ